jgi:D-alanyl-D-alanine carboxypeptidase
MSFLINLIERTLRIFLLLFLLTTSSVMAHQPELLSGLKSDLNSLSMEIDSIVAKALNRGDLVGASISVLIGDTLIHSRGYGIADLENTVPASSDTRYYIGSITKTFTAAAIMRLAEQGQLSLDDDVSFIIPELSDTGPVISLRHLLSHTSGLAGPPQVLAKFINRRHLEFSRDQLLELLHDEPRLSDPGEKYAYNNLGYIVLGIVAERVSGKSFENYLREDLHTPDTELLCDSRRIIPHRASGYIIQNGEPVNHEPVNASLVFAAGGLCANADDVAGWFRALTAGEIVSPVSFNLMVNPVVLSNQTKLQYGFGLVIDEIDGLRRIYHSGVVNGFAGLAVYYPGQDMTVVILTNTRSGASRFIEQQITHLINSII